MTLRFLLLLSAIATIQTTYAQFSGVGVTNPTHAFHVRPTGSANPLRIDGLNPATTADTKVLVLDPATGVIKTVDRSTFTDNQALSYNATTQTLQLARGGVPISLSALADNLGDHTATEDLLIPNDDLIITDGKVEFGSGNAQRINLSNGEAYGIGVQSSTQYYRSTDNYAWFRGGTHVGGALNAGTGGTVMMVLTGSNRLGLNTIAPTQTLDVNGQARIRTLPTGTNADDVITVDAAGNMRRRATNAAGDNLGNHTATENIHTNGHWLSNDGDDEGLFVRDNGYLGVGKDNPTNFVDIQTSTRSGPHENNRPLYVTSNSSPAGNGVEFVHSNKTQGIGFGYNSIYAAGTNTNQSLNLIPNGSSGVGIGTLNPTAKLDVDGTARIRGLGTGANADDVVTVDANGNLRRRTTTAIGDNFGNHRMTQNLETAGRWISNDGDSEGLFVTATGRVGIGTDDPKVDFVVESDNASYTHTITENTAGAQVFDSYRSNGGNVQTQFFNMASGASWTIGNKASDNDKFVISEFHNIGAFNRFTILQGGNVGIGTNNPNANLHIDAGAFGDAVLRLEADSDGSNDGDNPQIIFEQDAGIEASAIGHGLLATANQNALQIANSITAGGIQFLTGGGTSGYTAASSRMRITEGGDVGIGTDDPSAKMDVVGTARIRTLPGGANADQVVTVDGAGNLRRRSTAAIGDNLGNHTATQDLGMSTHDIDFSTGDLNFGNMRRQMVNLWNESYGIGIQSNTQYYRSASTFAWYRGGVHNNDQLNAGGGEAVMALVGSGNLGIGTTTPASKLTVHDNNNNANYSGNVQVDIAELTFRTNDFSSINASSTRAMGGLGLYANYTNNTARRKLGGVYGQIGSNQSGHLIFTTLRAGVESEKMVITEDGNIGIGTLAPTADLHISATNGGDAVFRLQADDSNSGATEGDNPQMIFTQDGGIDVSGVGHGLVASGANQNVLQIANSVGGGGMEFLTAFDNAGFSAAISRMFITQTGNIGIGTNNPFQRLHVVGNIFATGSITSSDSTLKTNIAPLTYGLNELLQLKPVTYNWKDAVQLGGGYDNSHQIGFLAQEVQVVIPEAVKGEEGNGMGIDYSKLIPVVIAATQQQQLLVYSLTATVSQQDKHIANLEARLARIEATLHSAN